MARPERELRRNYEATQQMQVTQLQNEYAQRGFTILHAGAELADVPRRVWAAYDPKTGDTYMFSGTRETSFGTGQSVLDAVGKWVERQNTTAAFNATMEDVQQRQSDLRASRETVHRMDARMQDYFGERTQQQPVQAARETPAQPAARTAEPVREERATEEPRTAPIRPPATESRPAVVMSGRVDLIPEERQITSGRMVGGSLPPSQLSTGPRRMLASISSYQGDKSVDIEFRLRPDSNMADYQLRTALLDLQGRFVTLRFDQLKMFIARYESEIDMSSFTIRINGRQYQGSRGYDQLAYLQ